MNYENKVKHAFSLVEILISLVVVSVLLAAFVPVITKKMSKNIDIELPSGSAPVGTIVMYLGQTPPSGWLVCNGEEFSETTYPKLYAHLKSNKLPDMRGYTPIGATDSDIQSANNGESFYNE